MLRWAPPLSDGEVEMLLSKTAKAELEASEGSNEH